MQRWNKFKNLYKNFSKSVLPFNKNRIKTYNASSYGQIKSIEILQNKIKKIELSILNICSYQKNITKLK